MIRDEDESEDYIYTQCSGTLVSFISRTPEIILNQIGSTWVVTAAHCLYKDGERVAAKSLSIMLGLHDRSKKSEPKRCHSFAEVDQCIIIN